MTRYGQPVASAIQGIINDGDATLLGWVHSRPEIRFAGETVETV